MTRSVLFLAIASAVLATACARPTPTLPPDFQTTVLLVSFDGFRWDYVDRYPTPEIQRLVARGARAEALIPPFPSKTFPSHYTIATGLYPEHHGIVANSMYDAQLNARFSLADRASVEDERWWGGEPIWVTGERQGRVTASLFWPGSEGPVDGVRPRYWALYDGRMSHEEQIDRVFEWLDKPIAERPVFIALYFNDTDDAGHREGPDSAAVGAAVERLDRTFGLLREGLERRDLADRLNVVLTSDHGMTEISRNRVIFLDDHVDLSTVDVVDWSPVLMLSARNGDHDAVYHRLTGAHPRLAVYRKHETPERLHFRDSPRITPIVGIADEGWTVTSRRAIEGLGAEADFATRATHGFDNALPSMHGILIAAGPAFKRGVVVPRVESVHVYEMLCRILGLTPAPNDGSPDALRAMLAEP